MTSSRKAEREKSLAALKRIAEEAKAQPWLSKEKQKPRANPPRMPPAPPALDRRRAPARAPAQAPALRKPLDPEFEGRGAKLEEQRRLRELRDANLHRAKVSEWRGMDRMNVPSGIRRTAFDRTEPSVTQKIGDVLGDAKEKEGRAKARAKGKRAGGRGA